ncbi:hypothetical protein [Cellulosimicrobium sp. CUA-896]|uniref:hypothetical protein n=1 Tax=Cellulosimicrobium sp. CUA-896 TaxID=1517881 RepID=UPI00096989A4|nr:hypothetical protein [Cellulosimicrobium sp. CUA-896]OLT53204.1 hypothetical protein BJF88_12540 [Cellulosimicrobium sp. CUA-896]
MPRPRWDLVVVDDYQEATVATARLLHVLQDDAPVSCSWRTPTRRSRASAARAPASWAAPPRPGVAGRARGESSARAWRSSAPPGGSPTRCGR